jgi:hypothetical protein
MRGVGEQSAKRRVITRISRFRGLASRIPGRTHRSYPTRRPHTVLPKSRAGAICAALPSPLPNSKGDPLLPWHFGGNRSQHTGNGFRLSEPSRAAPPCTDCQQLRPLGPHKAPTALAPIASSCDRWVPTKAPTARGVDSWLRQGGPGVSRGLLLASLHRRGRAVNGLWPLGLPRGRESATGFASRGFRSPARVPAAKRLPGRRHPLAGLSSSRKS